MCDLCDYETMLNDAGLESTPNRIAVLEAIGGNQYPLSASNIHNILERSSSINRVTVYRILDLLVEHDVVNRLSTGGRAFYYGLAPNEHHREHAHFYCKRCGQMDCLTPESLTVDTSSIWKTFPGRIDKIEIRIDGVCKNCLK